jgi:Carboxypeptidase regulatory-like domain
MRTNKLKLHLALLLIPVVLQVVPLALAQIAGSGSIQGVISDPSGAVIAGVPVEATNVATNVKTSRKTTDAGYYVISPLPAGEYTVTVAAPGFQTLIQEHVVVDALSTVGLNLALTIGTTAQQMTITGAIPELNTSDASVGQTIRNEVYSALPLTMGTGGASLNSPRDPTAFVSLMPGVTGYGSNNTVGGSLGAGIFTQEVYLEGIPLTTSVLQGEVRYLSFGVSVEAVDQFELNPANASVIYGGQGSTNFVLKSGTNRYHGSAWEFARNNVFAARGFFPSVRPDNNQNEYGGTFGGPIKKDRIFYFGSFEGYRTKFDSAPTLVSIPTLLERQGNFSQFPATIYDPTTTNCTPGPCTRTAFPGNIIPTARLSSASQFLESFLPAPTSSAIQSNYLGSVPVGFKTRSIDIKVDASLTDKHRFEAVFSDGTRNPTTLYRNGNIPLPYTDTRTVMEHMTTAQVKYTFVISNNLINQVNAGINRFHVPITDQTIDSNCGFGSMCGNWMNAAGITGLPGGAASQSFPWTEFDGPNSPSMATTAVAPATGWRTGNSQAFNEIQNNLTIQDNVVLTRGRHAFSFGGQIQWLQANEKPQTYGSSATFDFSNSETAGFSSTGTLLNTTGNSYASFLLGQVNSNTINDDTVVEAGARFRTYAWWAQDNIKVSPRLTVNLGFRQDLFTPWVEANNRMSWLNPTLPNPAVGGFPGALQFAGNGPDGCNCRNPGLSTYGKNLEPRIGFNFSISPKTVFRAGFAINSTRDGAMGGSGTKVGTGLLGYNAIPTFSSPNSGITAAYNWNNGVPSYQKGPFFQPTINAGFYNGIQGGSITYGDPRVGAHPPRYQNWNVALERVITPTLTLDLIYVANNAHYITATGGKVGIWTNQLNPSYLALGNLLLASATPANVAAAQAIIPGVTLPYPTFTGAISQMLLPFPQYTTISDVWADIGNSNYNSLQVVARQTLWRGLTVDFNYTFAKAFDDLTTGNTYADQKAQSINPLHAVNVLFVYQLPVGKNRTFSPDNTLLRAIASNWEVSGVTTYRSGLGLGSLGASCNLPNAGTCYANFNPAFSGPVRINGKWGSHLLRSSPIPYLASSAFTSPPAFSYGNTPRTLVDQIYGPSSYNQNLTLRRDFPIRESMRLTIQADSLNVFNWVNFANPTTTVTSSTFGNLTSQSNSPRIIQFGAKFTF